MTKLEHALAAVRLGFAVFPLVHTLDDGSCSCGSPECKNKGKHPITTSGFKNATTDEEKIREWWTFHPEANIGAYPGEKIVVIDLDEKTGKEGVKNFCERVGKDLWAYYDTMVIKTPSGGYHLYFKSEVSYNSGNNVLQGVDVRGVGGYVVAPGSVIGGKAYTHETMCEPRAVPEEIITLLRRPRERAENAETPTFDTDSKLALDRGREMLADRLAAVEGAGGDDWTYKTFCILRDYCISKERAVELMCEKGGWNDRCLPPWSPSELSKIAANVYKYAKSPMGERGGTPEEIMEGALDDIEDVVIPDKYAAIREQAFFGGDLARRGKRREFVIPGWLPAQGFTACTAPRGLGKSTVIFDQALRLACDMSWFDLTTEKGRTVVYFCAEDDEGAELMMMAWMREHNMEPADDRFVLIAGAPNLSSAESVMAYAEFLKSKFGDRRCVLYIDTWQRATYEADQIDNKAMQVCIRKVEWLAQQLNAPAVIACHPPKGGDGIMGTGVVENSSRAIWALREHALGLELMNTRIKGKGKDNVMYLTLNVHDLGEKDQFGAHYTAVLPAKVGGNAGKVLAQDDEALKRAFAGVFRELDGHRGNDGLTHAFTPKTFIERLFGTVDRSKPWEGPVLVHQTSQIDSDGVLLDESSWANGLLHSLFEAGIVDHKPALVLELLHSLFPDNGTYTYEDGMKLVFRKLGNGQRTMVLEK